MSKKAREKEALDYHEFPIPGKIEVVPTTTLSSQLDLALAYSPGVAVPCLAIEKNPSDVYKYTAKGNLVGVISNGTAVLGLGNIGAAASKPVMEGKGVLFKKFAGIDVFDIEIDETDPDKFIEIVKSLEPTFGGINLEDIKAPESFKIETELRKLMNIPVMHDDQHGTAIISAAGMLNALDIVGKKIDKIKVVVNGAGASAVACAKLYLHLGVKKSNLLMLDSKGIISTQRTNLSESKAPFATDTKMTTLEEAMKGADLFLGLSKGDVVDEDMVRSMAKNPIIFALANPDPEIPYAKAMAVRDDIIMATGRSDHPNQVNNVLGFPFIFRGALDVRATEINEEMKIAAVKAIANLAKEPVPDVVSKAYSVDSLTFGPKYLIPKPLDLRLITTISPAVAKAAIASGVAQRPISDWAAYDIELQKRIGIDQKLMSGMITRAKKDPKKVVFAEAENIKILQAAQTLVDQGIAQPILLGDTKRIKSIAEENNLDLHGCEIINPKKDKKKAMSFSEELYNLRNRKGLTMHDATKLIKNDRGYFAAMMLESGEADAMISGLTKDHPKALKPALDVIGPKDGINKVAGMYILQTKRGDFFCSDTTMNIDPNAEQLVDIISNTARGVRFFGVEPRIAMLSYSNFGSAKGEVPQKIAKAAAIAKEKWPDLILDGDIQANVALNTELQRDNYGFSALADKGANTLIFPNLAAGNIAYKLLVELGSAEAIGPVLLGMRKPVHILQLGSSVREIVNMAAIAVVDAQTQQENRI